MGKQSGLGGATGTQAGRQIDCNEFLEIQLSPIEDDKEHPVEHHGKKAHRHKISNFGPDTSRIQKRILPCADDEAVTCRSEVGGRDRNDLPAPEGPVGPRDVPMIGRAAVLEQRGGVHIHFPLVLVNQGVVECLHHYVHVGHLSSR